MGGPGHVKPSLISAIAESVGIADLSDDAARVLAPDVEYRVRDILQVRLQLYRLNTASSSHETNSGVCVRTGSSFSVLRDSSSCMAIGALETAVYPPLHYSL